RRPAASGGLREAAVAWRLPRVHPHDVPGARRVRREWRATRAARADEACETDAPGDGPQPGLDVGYYQAARTAARGLLLPLCCTRPVQSYDGRLAARRARERGARRTPLRRNRRAPRRGAWCAHRARRSWLRDEVGGPCAAPRLPRC